MRALLASFLIVISGACYAQGFDNADQSLASSKENPTFLPVEQAYKLEIEVIDEQNIRAYWQIAPNYYLYQHKFDFALENDQGVIALNVELPVALSRNDEYFGEVQVYYHNADINLQVQQVIERGTLSVTSRDSPPFTSAPDSRRSRQMSQLPRTVAAHRGVSPSSST